MLVAETCLLLAVRAKLRTDLHLADTDCDIVFEDELPPTAPKLYVAIAGVGAGAGERHSSSGVVWDMRFSARVTVYQRMADIARDRRRSVFIERLTGLNAVVDQVIRSLDNSNSLMRAAELLLVGSPAAGGQFPEPFREFQIDPAPRAVFADPYEAAQMQNAAMGDPLLAMARSVSFQRARFMKGRA